jgi:hypothetical protein
MTAADFEARLPVSDASWGPAVDIHSNQPTPARMYDHMLGGKDNFSVDREAVDRIRGTVGSTMTSDVVWENRQFLRRAVRWLAEAGIDQFIDIGAGLPTQGNVHEIAQQVNPDAHIVYVDNDPTVLTHGRALLADNRTTTVITADARNPESIYTHPDLIKLIDFARPVAVLFVAVLHFITDEEDPKEIVSAFRDKISSGSYVALSHLTSDGPPAHEVERVEAIYRAATSPMIFRSCDEIADIFGDLVLVEPGLVRPSHWNPAGNGPETYALLAGVGIKTA